MFMFIAHECVWWNIKDHALVHAVRSHFWHGRLVEVVELLSKQLTELVCEYRKPDALRVPLHLSKAKT